MTEYYRVKDDVAFSAIRGKRVRIVGRLPDTEDGVVIRADPTAGLPQEYKFRMSDLEPWAEPETKPRKYLYPCDHCRAPTPHTVCRCYRPTEPRKSLTVAARLLAGVGVLQGGGTVPYEAVLAAVEALLGPGWQGMANAPLDGREVLVRLRPDETWRTGRKCVARYIPALEAWALWPGCAVGTEELDAWRALPPELEA